MLFPSWSQALCQRLAEPFGHGSRLSAASLCVSSGRTPPRQWFCCWAGAFLLFNSRENWTKRSLFSISRSLLLISRSLLLISRSLLLISRSLLSISRSLLSISRSLLLISRSLLSPDRSAARSGRRSTFLAFSVASSAGFSAGRRFRKLLVHSTQCRKCRESCGN